MTFGILSFKSLIALVCVIQCLMILVSSIRCVHCMADEDGHCMMPFTKKGYDVECTKHMQNREDEVIAMNLGKILTLCLTGGKTPAPGAPPPEYDCVTAKGKSGGEKFIYKSCMLRDRPGSDFGCQLVKLLNIGGFRLDSCESCTTDLCNSANNLYIKFTYFLPSLALLYSGVY